MLFLADVPDQVRVLTLYGKLQMGFKNVHGDQVAFQVADLPPPTPTTSLEGPADGGSAAAGELNGRGFIDVTYAIPTGDRLDDSSITDLAPEFTISSTGGTIALDSTQAPILINATTHTYRYWTVSNNATGIALTPDQDGLGWALVDGTGNTVSNPLTASAAFGPIDTTHVATPYVDLGLAPTANQTPVGSTLGAGDVTFSQNGTVLPITVSTTLAPTQIPGSNVYRYYLSGSFPLGKIDVTFPAGAWTDSAGATSAAGSASFTVVQPTTTVTGPFNGATIDAAVANADTDGASGPHYIDLTYTPPTGASLDYQSIYVAYHAGTVPSVTAMIQGESGLQTVTLGPPVAITMSADPTTGVLTPTPIVVHPQTDGDADRRRSRRCCRTRT